MVIGVISSKLLSALLTKGRDLAQLSKVPVTSTSLGPAGLNAENKGRLETSVRKKNIRLVPGSGKMTSLEIQALSQIISIDSCCSA